MLNPAPRTLAPGFDLNAAIRRYATEITEQQMARDFSLNALFSTAVDLKNFIQHLPGRISRILDLLAAVKILVSDITAKRKPSRGAPTRTST